MCICRVRKGRGVGLVCGLDIAGSVVVEWEKYIGWFSLGIGYCLLCSGIVRRGTVIYLVCGLDLLSV
jgi:hypothetical protein